MYILYGALKAIHLSSMVLIVSTVISFFINRWQKKYDKENANFSKSYEMFLLKAVLVGLGCLTVSSICLFLRIY